ncbi:thioredoxin [Tamlana nanhaiensis]|uniref:Thioredoxin n=1 Tax=Neotamlana nanhaiensis TaxID=1382798 RepID=A0A0D7VXH7_9FLAO|nr:thioredoxin [Tamlana nanhaiensis]KJD31590.1 thioredoxin [Tamlana nanhaiensis]
MKSSFNNIIQSEKVVLVDFFATWCGPCQALMPILKDVKTEIGDAAKIVKIDIDKNNELAVKYQVRSVPTMILFVDGEPKWRQSGVLQKSDILNVLNVHSGIAV